ncbi:MAG: right-handed parallel beta-helix repeat-containing protein [Candidatus Heimdallarchaeota archaeon]|nr:right-handed parallel beta-helix repeat-containing protein [Candidatus Heimdallarchaeota archaeon]
MISSLRKNLIILSLVILFSFNTVYSNNYVNADPGSIRIETFSFPFVSHSPIVISSDDDFLAFPGSGTLEDPFLIEGFNITSSNPFGIHISSTTKYILIKNCFIDVSLIGILIEDVLDGSVRIEDNIIVDSEDMNGHGIVIYIAREVVLKNNFISNHASSGFVLAGADYCYILNNSFTFNGQTGMEVVYVNTLGIFENECNDNAKGGMYVGGGDLAIIMGNDCSRNGEEGIYLEESESCAILNNTIEGNGLWGMKMDGASGSLLNYNLFRDNVLRGLYLDEDCENNWTYMNDFIKNSGEGYSQGRDEGGGNHWCNEIEEKGNYWNDLDGRNEYEIAGNTKTKDIYPYEKPIGLNSFTSMESNKVEYTFIIFPLEILYFTHKQQTHKKKFRKF